MRSRFGHPPPKLQPLGRTSSGAEWSVLSGAESGAVTVRSLPSSPVLRRTRADERLGSPIGSPTLWRTRSDECPSSPTTSFGYSGRQKQRQMARTFSNTLNVEAVEPVRARPSSIARFRSATSEVLITPPPDEEACSVQQELASPSAGNVRQRQTRSRPWRKAQSECLAEVAEAENILMQGPDAARAVGVDAQALLYYLLAQECLTEDAGYGEKTCAQQALDALRQAATNAQPAEEIQAAKEAAASALAAAGLEEPSCQRLPKNGSCHQVLPGLLVGGWAALGQDCAELRRRKVTHVVSIVSAEQQQLPEFVRGHLHIFANDKEDAAAQLAARFPEVCRFVNAARNEPRGVVFIHCGAGISRAPTAAASYIMWKLGMPAVLAIKLIRAARPCIRPNIGFARQLANWETEMRNLEGFASGASTTLLGG